MTFFIQIWEILKEFYPFLLKGIGMTLLISLIGTVAGLVIGLLTGIIRTTPFSKNKLLRVIHKIVNGIIAVYIEIFRGTPMMVQAMVIFWGYAFMNDGQTLPLIPAGIFIVSINTGAYMAEIVRGGIISIDKGQFEGAYSVGMTHWQAMLYVVVPQVMRNILPSVSNEFVINIKDTSVLNVIGVAELYFMAGKIIYINLEIFQTYTIVCVLYFIMTFSVTRILRLFEKKLNGRENYTICGSQSDPAAEIHIKEEAK
ncbi:MAG: amino acid ABC transporter permease [Clostridia bacterium]|nr:amino acid ABC transporter permease [Clostridia bacterium]